MPNIIETATIFQQALDKQVTESATSGWMEDNAGQVVYSGGKEIKIPKVNMDGLGDYDKAKGYTEGAVTFEYETHTMTQDRDRKFRLDRMDVDETKFILNATSVMSEFQRTKVIPEVDAYRYSTLYKKAKAKGYIKEYTPAAETLLSTLLSEINAVQDKCGTDTELVITMSISCASVLDSVKDITKHIDAATFKQGEVSLNIKRFSGIPVIRASTARMKSAYEFLDGKTAGKEKGGFVPASGAVNINWIICAKKAPIAVSKTDKIKIIDPDVNPNADAWDIMYRKYHDIWIPDNALETVRVCADNGAAG